MRRDITTTEVYDSIIKAGGTFRVRDGRLSIVGLNPLFKSWHAKTLLEHQSALLALVEYKRGNHESIDSVDYSVGSVD